MCNIRFGSTLEKGTSFKTWLLLLRNLLQTWSNVNNGLRQHIKSGSISRQQWKEAYLMRRSQLASATNLSPNWCRKFRNWGTEMCCPLCLNVLASSWAQVTDLALILRSNVSMKALPRLRETNWLSFSISVVISFTMSADRSLSLRSEVIHLFIN